MKEKKGFLRIYLILVIVFGLLGLVESILAFIGVTFNQYLYFSIIGIIIFFFFFNIISLAILKKQGVKRIAYVLPIYYIITIPLFFGVGVGLVLKESAILQFPFVISLISSLFEISFSIYTIIRLKLFKSDHSTTFHTESWEAPKF